MTTGYYKGCYGHDPVHLDISGSTILTLEAYSGALLRYFNTDVCNLRFTFTQQTFEKSIDASIDSDIEDSLIIDLTNLTAEEVTLNLSVTYTDKTGNLLNNTIKRFSSLLIFLAYMGKARVVTNPGTRLNVKFTVKGIDSYIVSIHHYYPVSDADLDDMLEATIRNNAAYTDQLRRWHQLFASSGFEGITHEGDAKLRNVLVPLRDRVINMLKDAGLTSLSLF